MPIYFFKILRYNYMYRYLNYMRLTFNNGEIIIEWNFPPMNVEPFEYMFEAWYLSLYWMFTRCRVFSSDQCSKMMYHQSKLLSVTWIYVIFKQFHSELSKTDAFVFYCVISTCRWTIDCTIFVKYYFVEEGGGGS